MEENKLFNEIKSAAENAEKKDFPGMEKVWQRVEEKLDKKEDKKTILLWKKIAVAASLLLFVTLGYQFLKNDPDTIKPNEMITVKDSVKVTEPSKDAVVTEEPKNPAIKKDAEQILLKQIKPLNQVASEEVKESNGDVNPATISTTQMGFSAPVPSKSSISYDKPEAISSEKETAKHKDVELFMNRNSMASSVSKKQEPLVVIEDKVSKRKLENIQFNAADSLVVLNEPLYIINGVEYSEKEVFGPEPTSPYTPLNKQEIETISVLQNEKAVEIYGKKGEKGVVIITTKNGKPLSASKKAK